MEHEDLVADAVLFARLRAVWEDRDPVPAGLVDRMVSAVAVADLSREYALLTLVAGDRAAVRGDADTLTLQFTDGTANVLLHVTTTEDDRGRIDGWLDADAVEVRLVQGEREWTAPAGEHGRFSFDGIRRGICRVRLKVRGADGRTHHFQTPSFEV